ncbi:hypothetical protein TraAM80_10158 [Trypanosoma rangeli]|uniref:Uncharacterized protein n=1 Tax=Trypanosoma rangeli TaxID=5698 RepID=A0A3R7LXN3_TRYRA|nr:uncharacterized protein TraAM80_10158 [Trypanosoma rangeli]RNE95607.1 hypothetical protein TraAM80_10158 [Trypanosoma rangeli]|eukprot:RNE95607.1 hypothetical protein TraAM80_10158 [Trypanosoma rangeli]
MQSPPLGAAEHQTKSQKTPHYPTQRERLVGVSRDSKNGPVVACRRNDAGATSQRYIASLRLAAPCPSEVGGARRPHRRGAPPLQQAVPQAAPADRTLLRQAAITHICRAIAGSRAGAKPKWCQRGAGSAGGDRALSALRNGRAAAHTKRRFMTTDGEQF